MHQWALSSLRFAHLLFIRYLHGQHRERFRFQACCGADGRYKQFAVHAEVLLAVDKFVTGPSAIILAISGLALALMVSPILLNTYWVMALIVAWFAGFVLAHLGSLPLLRELHDYSCAHLWLDKPYHEKSRRWNILNLGYIAPDDWRGRYRGIQAVDFQFMGGGLLNLGHESAGNVLGHSVRAPGDDHLQCLSSGYGPRQPIRKVDVERRKEHFEWWAAT